MNSEKYTRIRKWLKLINKKPNNNCNYFYLSDNEKALIISLEKMPTLLAKIDQVKDCQRRYLFIDVSAPAVVRYYGFNIDTKTRDFVDEVSGDKPFAEVEDALFSFFEDNAGELSKWDVPFTQLSEESIKEETRIIPNSSTNLLGPSRPPTNQNWHQTNHGWTTGYNGHTPYQNTYDSTTYKDREAFNERIYILVKTGRTSQAIDYINHFMTDKKESNKDLVAAIFRHIAMEKLDLFTIREMLLSTSGYNGTDRAAFANKFIESLKKTKPKSVNYDNQ